MDVQDVDFNLLKIQWAASHTLESQDKFEPLCRADKHKILRKDK